MGNVDQTVNQELMQRHKDLTSNFVQQRPLFNIEDISFPLSTADIRIVDTTGRRVKLAGGNWSGGHMCRHCVDGLQCRPMRDIAMDIRYKFKMNCIRLTYSMQLFYDNKVVPEKYLKANPDLIGKTSMEIFDITVKTLTDVGLMVILNNHTSTSQWCCSDDDGDGLWWSHQYPEYQFFESSEEFARRYKDNPRVIGMDLRNQIRKANGLTPTWGEGTALTDWKRAATICGQKVLKIAPHWLIFVSGLNYQLDLTGVQRTTIKFSVPNKLVYTGHFYGFSWPIPSWNLVSYQDFKKKLFNSQTFVRGLGYPYYLGEYGNNQKDIPWNYLIRYLKETDIDWTYWALDGFKCEPEKDETYGVFTNDFTEARHPELLEDMISVGPPPGTVIERPVQLQNKQVYYPPPQQREKQPIYYQQRVNVQGGNPIIEPRNINVMDNRNLPSQPLLRSITKPYVPYTPIQQVDHRPSDPQMTTSKMAPRTFVPIVQAQQQPIPQTNVQYQPMPIGRPIAPIIQQNNYVPNQQYVPYNPQINRIPTNQPPIQPNLQYVPFNPNLPPQPVPNPQGNTQNIINFMGQGLNK